MHHVTILHGIHQGLTDPGWTAAFADELELRLDRVATDTEHYRASVFAPWNLWVKNPLYARHHAARIAGFVARRPDARIHLVAHSNGTNIAVEIAKRLARQEIAVSTLILVGSAVHSDVEVSGIADLVSRGWVQRVVAYCSDDDRIIRRLQSIPGFYGSLGTRGLELDGDPIGLRLRYYEPIEGRTPIEWGRDRYRYVTRWFSGYRHSQWFAPQHRAETFECFLDDMGLA